MCTKNLNILKYSEQKSQNLQLCCEQISEANLKCTKYLKIFKCSAQNYQNIEVKMKCFFIDEIERAAKIRKIVVYRFLISLLLPTLQSLKMSSFRSKNARKSCRNQSKSIKFVTSRVGHVDRMNK